MVNVPSPVPGTSGAVGSRASTDDAAGHIGPNAITRLAEAIDALHGTASTGQLFHAAGLGDYLEAPPERMVDEAQVILLHRLGRAQFGPVAFAEIAQQAGRLTAVYVLRHRIPRLVQWFLRMLPAPIAARLLSRAIAAHAWTFVGSGKFSYRFGGRGLDLSIANSPLARGERSQVSLCGYYSATFEGIYGELVSPNATVSETQCAAMHASLEHVCRFEVRF